MSFTGLLLAQEAVDTIGSVDENSPGWKDKAKGVYDSSVDTAKTVGTVVADRTVEGYHGTVNYFKNNTVGDIADDVVDVTKKAGTKIADGAKTAGQGIADVSKKAWGGIKDWFSRR